MSGLDAGVPRVWGAPDVGAVDPAEIQRRLQLLEMLAQSIGGPVVADDHLELSVVILGGERGKLNVEVRQAVEARHDH